MSDDLDARMRLVANEQVKLSANLLNNLAGGATIAGFLGPVTSALYNLQLPASPYWIAFLATWIIVAAALHYYGRLKLKELVP